MDKDEPFAGRSDRGSTVIAAGIIAAALIVSWSLPDSEPRYQLVAPGSGVVRMNTDSGELISCDAQRCVQIEASDRAKTLGPISMRIGGGKESGKSVTSQPQPTNSSQSQ